MRLLLHACCGPCLIEPLDGLLIEGDEVAVAFFNPNIHPFEEHERRLATLQGYAAACGVAVHVSDYEPELWVRAVGEALDSPQRRCRACYALRLRRSAHIAAEMGFDAIATTLTVSPYQDPEAIREEGCAAARAAGIAYLDTDFRDRYRDAVRRSRELGMYRQNYCGCVVSEVEARRERAARGGSRRRPERAGHV